MTVTWQPAPNQTRQDIEDRRAVRDIEIARKYSDAITRRVQSGAATECWEWSGPMDKQGYGILPCQAPKNTTRQAHRMAYTLWVGEIPEGLHLDHLCRNRACCNPAHLEPVTCRENWERGLAVTRAYRDATACKRGHTLEGDNLYRHPSGARVCRKCNVMHVRNYQQRVRDGVQVSRKPRPSRQDVADAMSLRPDLADADAMTIVRYLRSIGLFSRKTYWKSVNVESLRDMARGSRAA